MLYYDNTHVIVQDHVCYHNQSFSCCFAAVKYGMLWVTHDIAAVANTLSLSLMLRLSKWVILGQAAIKNWNLNRDFADGHNHTKYYSWKQIPCKLLEIKWKNLNWWEVLTKTIISIKICRSRFSPYWYLPTGLKFTQNWIRPNAEVVST